MCGMLLTAEDLKIIVAGVTVPVLLFLSCVNSASCVASPPCRCGATEQCIQEEFRSRYRHQVTQYQEWPQRMTTTRDVHAIRRKSLIFLCSECMMDVTQWRRHVSPHYPEMMDKVMTNFEVELGYNVVHEYRRRCIYERQGVQYAPRHDLYIR